MAEVKEAPAAAEQGTGRIAQVIGAVVDVEFADGNLPDINDAVVVTNRAGKETVLEVELEIWRRHRPLCRHGHHRRDAPR